MNPLDVVHGGDRSFGISLLSVANESKATAATSVTILDDDLDHKVNVISREEQNIQIQLTASSTAPNSSNF
jgi:hypothetical protein